MQRLLIFPGTRTPRTRAFTLVEIMVVVVIIGLIAAMALPGYRRITMRSKTAALVSDLKAYSTAFITYNLQNGKWPADGTPQQIPPEMAGALPTAFTGVSPIGGVYKWNFGVTAVGVNCKAAIIIETSGTAVLTDDKDLLEMIDAEMDDGNTHSGNLVYAPGALVYVIE